MRLRSALAAAAALLLTLPALAQASLPVDPGETVMTHAGVSRNTVLVQPNWPVVRLFDTRDPAATGDVPANGSVFPAPFTPAAGAGVWTSADLGQVFGVALTDGAAPDIYVASTALYGIAARPSPGVFVPGQYGGGTPGSILRIDGTTGATSVFSTALANSGPAVGQIAYDPAHQQIYATDLDDGLLHRIDADPGSATYGQSLGTFDHGMLGNPRAEREPCQDDGSQMDPDYDAFNTNLASGFTQVCRRIWGVGVWNGRVYYGTWAEDQGLETPGGSRISATVDNEVWSVAVDAAGAFLPATVQRDIVMPPFTAGANWSMPISDLSFAADGRMLIGERATQDDTFCRFCNSGQWAHRARVLEYAPGGTWTFTQQHSAGQINSSGGGGANGAGGVAWNGSVMDEDPAVDTACDVTVQNTNDLLNFETGVANGERYAYGFQMSPAAGTDTDIYDGDGTVNALPVDWDQQFNSTAEKFLLGDLETNAPQCAPPVGCMEVGEVTIECLGNDRYQMSFDVTNTSPFSAPADFVRVWLPGAATPTVIPLGGLPSGATTTVTFSFTSADPPGSELCVILQLVGADTDGNGHPDWSCEKIPVCGELPDCPDPCIDISEVFTEPGADGLTGVTATFTNNGSGPAGHVAVTALTPNAFAGNVVLTPSPVPLGGTGQVTFDAGVAGGAPPGTVLTFRVDLHGDFDPVTGEYDWCCTTVVEVTLEDGSGFAVTGIAYEDADGDGFAGADEAPIAGAAVTAVASGSVVAEAVTDTQGRYMLSLDAVFGAVTVSVDAGDDWTPSAPSDGETTISCDADGCSETTLPFGFVSSFVAGESGPGAALSLRVWPNPARGAATVSVTLPSAGDLSVTVYDVLGREVARLADGPAPGGEHAFGIGAELPSGTYLVRVTHGETVSVRTLSVVR